MVLGIAVDLSALPYFLRSFTSPHRAGVPSRLFPVGSDCASRRRAVSRGSAHPRSETRVGVGSGVWPGLPVGEAVLEAGWRPKRALQSERRAGVKSGLHSSLARHSGWRSDRPSGLSFRYLGRPMSCMFVCKVVRCAEPLLGSRSTRDPEFMNPTLCFVKK